MAQNLSEDIINFFHAQNFVIVSTISKDGFPHNACKGIIEIKPEGKIYILDLYRGDTCKNLNMNPNISITAIDEHKFRGYCLVGQGRIAQFGELAPDIIQSWEARITSRITQRVLKNISTGKGHPKHPEALLPEPKYMIAIDTQEVINLTPQHLKEEA